MAGPRSGIAQQCSAWRVGSAPAWSDGSGSAARPRIHAEGDRASGRIGRLHPITRGDLCGGATGTSTREGRLDGGRARLRAGAPRSVIEAPPLSGGSARSTPTTSRSAFGERLKPASRRALPRRPSLPSTKSSHALGHPRNPPVRTFLDLATVSGPEDHRAFDQRGGQARRDRRRRRSAAPSTTTPASRAYARSATSSTSTPSASPTTSWNGYSARSPQPPAFPIPLTKHMVNKFEVDFFWPDLGLVVETDGWRYHRTPSAQTRDALRFQVHVANGLNPAPLLPLPSQVRTPATYKTSSKRRPRTYAATLHPH